MCILFSFSCVCVALYVKFFFSLLFFLIFGRSSQRVNAESCSFLTSSLPLSYNLSLQILNNNLIYLFNFEIGSHYVYSLDCPRTCCIDQDGLTLRDLPAYYRSFKNKHIYQVVVANAFSPSTEEAEAGGTLSTQRNQSVRWEKNKHVLAQHGGVRL